LLIPKINKLNNSLQARAKVRVDLNIIPHPNLLLSRGEGNL
jgi:hypothetical protein